MFPGNGSLGAADTVFTVYGGAGNDKILGAENVGGALIKQFGDAGNDMIYGSSGTQAIYGTDDSSGQINLAYGGEGDDKYFGDDGGYLNIVYGGAGDDKILGGNNWGTSDSIDDYGFTLNYGWQVLVGGDVLNYDAANDWFEYDAENGDFDDGDDFLDAGDGNYVNFISGYGGNDKLIGGTYLYGQYIYGGHGDDLIYAINPSQRGTAIDVLADGAYDPEIYGGPGNDEIHGSSLNDEIAGDQAYYGSKLEGVTDA